MKLLCTLAAAALVAAAPAHAAPVTFNFDLAVVTADAPASDPLIWDIVPVGTRVRISYTYDTGAALQSTTTDPGGGTQQVFAGTSLALTIDVPSAGFSETFTFANQGGGRIILRDNFPDPGLGDLIDGLSLSLFDTKDPAVATSFGLILRGPTLDLVNGGLPGFQDPRWGSQRIASFEICRDTRNTILDCDLGLLQARPVPAPPTLALAALGLIGVATTRRRRR